MNDTHGRWLCLWTTIVVLGIVTLPSHADAQSCGANISSSVTLTGNLSGCTGNGLNVTADGVTINCAGFTIDGDDSGTDTGIDATSRSNVSLVNCTVTDFYRGVRFEDVSGGSITDSDISSNLFYGIDLVRSTAITVADNDLLGNGNEGIHVTGQLGGGGTGACPSSHPGGNTIVRNLVGETGEEGIYILCSDNNRIESNLLFDNGQAGIRLDESSTANLVASNSLTNDAIQVKLSTNNSLINNDLTDDSFMSPPARIFFESADSNYAENNVVEGSDEADQCYKFQNGADCNQLIRSSCFGPDSEDIQASSEPTTPAQPSINNRFFEFSRSFETLCSFTTAAGSTIDVYDTSNTLIGCSLPGPDVNPASCTWWAFDELCDEGGTANPGAVQSNASSIDLDNTTVSVAQYYRANTGAVRLSVTTPVIVSATGCLSVSAATTVELHPGTEIEGKFRAVVM